jgi:hypothetical protein
MPDCYCGVLAYDWIRRSRGTVPSSYPGGKKAVKPNGEVSVHVGVQDIEQAAQFILRQRGERRDGGAARQVARLATLPPLRAAATATAAAARHYGGCDTTGQGNGSNEREEGVGEHHCEEDLDESRVLKVLFVGGNTEES